MITRPKVFISYSHDSTDHKNTVLNLTQTLRRDGINANIDAFEGGSPAVGWQLWMEREVEESDFIVIVCTDTYNRRFSGKEEIDKGRGVAWESILARDDLYQVQGRSNKYIPVIFEDSTDADIPKILRTRCTHYRLPSQYEELLRVITCQPAIVPAEIGNIPTLTSKPSQFIDNNNSFFFADCITEYMRKLNVCIEKLTKDQYRVILQLKGNRRVRVSGLAGSGKTLVAAEKAIRLSLGGITTLFLCHNPLLASHVSHMTKGTGVQVISFYEWLEGVVGAETKSINWTKYVEPSESLLDMAFDALMKSGPQYEAIIVDEGQDFKEEWWCVIEAALVGHQFGILYIFHDDNQALIPFRASYPVQNNFDLSRNCRNAGKIYDVMRAIHPSSPPPEPDLVSLGKTTIFNYTRGLEKKAITEAVRWLYEAGADSNIKVILGGDITYDNSAFNGLTVIISKSNWKDAVRSEFALAFNVFCSNGVTITKKLADSLPSVIDELSDDPFPSYHDIEVVRKFARRFALQKDVRKEIEKAPYWRDALCWTLRDGNLFLYRRHSSPRWAIETILHFQREDWTVGLPKPIEVRFASFTRVYDGAIPVYHVSDYKGLEADFVLYYHQGRGLIPINDIYVGISRARMLLGIVVDPASVPVYEILRDAVGNCC